MRALSNLLVLLLLGTAPAQAESLAFVNVNVIPMTSEAVLHGRDSLRAKSDSSVAPNP